jgi:hypothetical protein
MATKKPTTGDVKAAVLRDCGFGQAGEVVTLPAADVEVGVAHGMLDADPAAVAYALSQAPTTTPE